MSLKCMIDKWLYKGQISQEEYDAVIKKLEGHDAEIKGQIIRDVLETVKEQNEIYLDEHIKQIRADAIEDCIQWIVSKFSYIDELNVPRIRCNASTIEINMKEQLMRKGTENEKGNT